MRNSRYTRGFLLLTVLAVFTLTGAGLARGVQETAMPSGGGTDQSRPPVVALLMNLSNVWSAVWNIGFYGDAAGNYPAMEWPGGGGSSYLYRGGLWGCCYGPVTANGDSISRWTSSNFSTIEFAPSVGYPAEKHNPGEIALEETHYGFDDWSTLNDNPFGMFCYTENYDWGTPGYNNFIASDYRIMHFSDHGNPGKPLGAFVMAIQADCDIASADPVENYLDDLVYYDGHAIWCNDGNATFEYEFTGGLKASEQDDYTYRQNPDNTLPEDDPENIFYYYNYLDSDGILDNDVDGNGVSDHFTILFKTLTASPTDTIWLPANGAGLVPFADGMPENNWKQTVGDTVYHVVPRNMSYMWDGNNAGSSSDDSGEPALSVPCNGFIGWRLLDFYIVKANGTIERPVDVYEYPIPLSHSWWNWNNDPGTDDVKYNFMWGKNPDMNGRHSAPSYLSGWVGNTYAPDAYTPDNPGPFPIVYDNPINNSYPTFDYRFLISMGPVNLEDGDTLHVTGGWVLGLGLEGLRQSADDMLDAFYRDSGWGVPALPPTPILFYSAGDGEVQLEWGSNAESFDPLGGYRIYRATFAPSGWDLIASMSSGTFSYTDETVTNGYPYYYVVCAYDADTGVESTRSNFKQTIQGTPLAVTPVLGASSNWKENVAVVPNPYRGSAPWEQTYLDKIAFINLPAMCNIHIYTLAGDHVITLEHHSFSGQEGTEFWDLISRNDQEVTSGLYIYRVETENDYIIGKFAVIR
ncbi:MAG: hypothetical protein GQ565_00295 [Candidatus Aegiribacteria sp.]|nr:hypothetical protein [Candidatus Aegiribacteria sp.]